MKNHDKLTATLKAQATSAESPPEDNSLRVMVFEGKKPMLVPVEALREMFAPQPPPAEELPDMNVLGGSVIDIDLDLLRPHRVNATRPLTLNFLTKQPNMKVPAAQVHVFGTEAVSCPQITHWANGVSEVKGPGLLLVWRDFFNGKPRWCGSWVELEVVDAV
jgi:hypothetical protein